MTDYEKKYKEALERAKELYDNKNASDARIAILEKVFPEIVESEDERTRKELIAFIKKQEGQTLPNNGETWIAWLELQGEQKPDKVEPKFKVGDWCIDNEDGTIFQIVKVLDNTYTYKTNEGKEYFCTHYSLENDARFWTIRDAKDGAVVVDKSDGAIGIFQSIGHHPDGGSYNDPSYCFLHCRYDDGYFYADFENGNTMDSYDVIPATKEQRSLLFQKMKEAGYKWDAEKKELKKIEDGSAWSEGDEAKLSRIYSVLRETASEHAFMTQKRIIGDKECVELQGFLKSLKDRVRPQKKEWSEEDRGNLLDVKCIIDEVWHNQYVREEIDHSGEELESLWHWLNNLWQRVEYPQKQWKPTERMLEALKWAKCEFHPDCPETMEQLKYLYQELKQLYYDRTRVY